MSKMLSFEEWCEDFLVESVEVIKPPSTRIKSFHRMYLSEIIAYCEALIETHGDLVYQEDWSECDHFYPVILKGMEDGDKEKLDRLYDMYGEYCKNYVIKNIDQYIPKR